METKPPSPERSVGRGRVVIEQPTIDPRIRAADVPGGDANGGVGGEIPGCLATQLAEQCAMNVGDDLVMTPFGSCHRDRHRHRRVHAEFLVQAPFQEFLSRHRHRRSRTHTGFLRPRVRIPTADAWCLSTGLDSSPAYAARTATHQARPVAKGRRHEFGYFTLSDNGYRDNTRSANTFVADIIDEAIEADRLGMHSAWVGEHHFSTLGVLSCPDLALAWIAARTTHIRLAPA